ncbi:MAG: hypothetical protein HQ523_09280 [Lentisphaerae bacterium]|nr:hypothetical protein [Lentisphaerota bacterium]
MMSGLFIAGAADQMARSNRAQSAGERASRTAAEVRSKNEALQCDVEKLFMITEALWSLLKLEHGYADEDLGRMIQDIDLRDGKLDGKVAKQPNPSCPECDRTLMGKHPVCLYCGTSVALDPFER